MRLINETTNALNNHTLNPTHSDQITTLDFLASRYPPNLTVDQVSEITSDASQTIRNRLHQGLYPIPSFYIGRKRLFRLIDVAAYLDRIYAACQTKPSNSKRRGRPTKAEQIIRQRQKQYLDDAPAPCRSASSQGGSRKRNASSEAETVGRPSDRQRSGGAARPAKAQRGHPADRSTVQGELCVSTTKQAGYDLAEPIEATQRSLRSRVAALCEAGPARRATGLASSQAREVVRPSGAPCARPLDVTDAQVASPPEPIPDFVPNLDTNADEVTYED
ncbi:MAG: hypothetical protein C0508_16375 [Cyanobacteria bacterium PR.023]|nr:hypothetical protein [Cyanobacteria bacterium PR.023]